MESTSTPLITLDLSKVNFLFNSSGKFNILNLIGAYELFIQTRGCVPEIILLNQEQYDKYENLLNGFSKKVVGVPKVKTLTFRGSAIEVKLSGKS